MKLGDIAKLVRGEVKGDPDIEISGVRPVETAAEGDITLFLKKKFLDHLKSSRASAVITAEAQAVDMAQVITSAPQLAFARVIAHFHPSPRPEPGIDSSARIGKNVKLGNQVHIGPYVVIGEGSEIGDGVALHPGVVIGDRCRIGNHATLHANVTVYSESVLGNHVILHSGVVIGADGFGYTIDEQGRHFKIPQLGHVVIEDHVEIGANSCVDRAAMGVTLIKEGTKIDNLVQVAHNCVVGEHSILVAQVGVAGSSTLGHHVVLAGQVGVADHIDIADMVTVGAKSGVLGHLPDARKTYGGTPAVPAISWRRYVAIFPRLPELFRKIREMENRLNKIEKQDSSG